MSESNTIILGCLSDGDVLVEDHKPFRKRAVSYGNLFHFVWALEQLLDGREQVIMFKAVVTVHHLAELLVEKKKLGRFLGVRLHSY